MKRIIVPYDFSEEARNGVALATVLAAKTHAAIQLVYVQKKHPDFAHLGPEDERTLVEKGFEELLAEIRKELPEDIELDYIIKKGAYQCLDSCLNKKRESLPRSGGTSRGF